MNQRLDLLAPWTGPMGGFPPLDAVTVEGLADAVDRALADQAREVDAIRGDSSEPTVQNTVLAIEAAGGSLRRVLGVYGTWCLSFSSPELRQVRRDLEPKIRAAHDNLYQDGSLYGRVKAAVAASGSADAELERLCTRMVERFEDAGAHLDDSARSRVAEINRELSGLYAEFSDRLLADEEDTVTWLSSDDLGGLAAAYVASAKAAATDRGRPDAWAVLNTRSSVDPFLTMSDRRDLREIVWRAYTGRGELRSATDTRPVAQEILRLRRERALLLGFDTHAHKALHRTMAGTPEQAVELMRKVWEPAKAAFAREVAGMQALADASGHGITIAPWDVRYYGEKLRQRDHNLDPSEVAAYFRLDKLREGMFWAATERFGWTFEEVAVPQAHDDVRVWAVHGQDGVPVGLFSFDPFARPGKRSGAWMNAFRAQATDADGERLPPIILNTCNFLKPGSGEPALLSLMEARTLFHEFGHAMHGLASAVRYRSLAGTAVPRDFVEFPSQLNEHWLTTTELLERFALHVDTGEPLPAPLLERIRAAQNADSGFRTMEFLASAVVDMMLHLAEDDVDVAVFEKETLAEWGLPHEVVMRHRTPQFAHIFSSDGYAAGYYSYLWADVLVADAAEAFAASGFYDKALSERYYALVLSRGDTVDAAEAFRAFLGRDPQVGALLRERGLVG